MVEDKLPKKSVIRRITDWSFVLAYAFAIFYLSSLSNPSPLPLPPIFGFDKVVHFIEYFILGFLLFSALNDRIAYPKRALIISFITATVYGTTDEIHQYFVPLREPDFLDILADSIGGLAGGYAGFITKRGTHIG